MKQVMFGVVALSLCVTAACNSEKKEEAASEAEEPAAEEGEKKDQPVAAGKAAEKPEETAETADGELDHDALLKQASSLEGKEVTVKAVSWGTSAMAGGKKRLNLGPQKLEGMRQAHLVADFEKDDTSVDAVNKDDEVTLKCKVGPKAYGARQLAECKIL